ncbi:MAG: hypothetical protein ACRDPA_10300 [Solirubrobacteraceae bacterium]
MTLVEDLLNDWAAGGAPRPATSAARDQQEGSGDSSSDPVANRG